MKSIRKTLLVLMIGLGFLPIAVLFLLTFYLVRESFLDSEVTFVRDLVSEVGQGVETRLAEVSGQLQRIARDPSISDAATFEQRMEAIASLHRLHAQFDQLTLYDPQGNLLAYSSEGPPIPQKVDTPFSEAVKGFLTLSDPYLINQNQDVLVHLYHPVPDRRGGVLFVLRGSLALAPIRGMVNKATLEGGRYFVLMNGKGLLLSHPDPDRMLTPLDPAVPVDRWSTRANGRYLDREHRDQWLFAARLIPPESSGLPEAWTLVAFRSMKAALFPFNRLLIGFGIASGVVLLLTTLAAVIMARRISRPILGAAHTADLAAAGNLNVRMPTSPFDEFRQLANAFNGTMEELAHYHEKMEDLVAQRTLKLDQANQAQVKLQAMLQAVYDAIQDAMIVVDLPSGLILAANARMQTLFGIEVSDVIGRPQHEVIQEIKRRFREQKGFLDLWNAHFRQPESSSNQLLGTVEPDGVLAVFTSPIRAQDGIVQGRLWMFRDVTQEKSVEEQLRQAQKMEAVGRLSGGIAHDFNNLLTGIMGNLSMARLELRNEADPSPYIHAATQAARTAAERIRELLTFARHKTLNLKPCQLNDIIEDVINLIRFSIDPRIEIETDLDPELWHVSADAGNIQQVLMNLCINAADAMPEGGKLVLSSRGVWLDGKTIMTMSDSFPGPYVCISVKDEGVGIPFSIQKEIFEPFFTTKAPDKGTGLGLAMSYGIVQQHGGWISVFSREGEGARFDVYLPKIAAESVAEVVRPPDQDHIVPGHETLLVIDDEVNIREMVRQMLTRFGYQVLVAESGERGMQILRDQGEHIQLILLDFTMPVLSGRDVLGGMKDLYPHIPVIMSSGYPLDQEDLGKVAGVRPVGYLQKPYEAERLAAQVRAMLDRCEGQSVARERNRKVI